MNKKIIVGVIIFMLALGAGYMVFGKKESVQQVADTQPSTDITVTETIQPETSKMDKKGGTYTLADVESHNTTESCWSTINGKVYDLTEWIGKHPGGPQKILFICGKDGSGMFDKQHGGQEKPEEQLSNFQIGALAE